MVHMEEDPVLNSRSSKYVDVALRMYIGPSVSFFYWAHLNATVRDEMEDSAPKRKPLDTKWRAGGPLDVHLQATVRDEAEDMHGGSVPVAFSAF